MREEDENHDAKMQPLPVELAILERIKRLDAEAAAVPRAAPRPSGGP